MVLKAIDYVSDPPSLKILNQLLLPHNMVYLPIEDCTAAHEAIKTMKVRGAPAIALVAILALAVEMHSYSGPGPLHGWIHERLDYLVTSRPTAVNLHDAARKLKRIVDDAPDRYVAGSYTSAAETMLRSDVEDNLAIGRHGAEHILQAAAVAGTQEKIAVLTICNTGSLATAGYGTAYSVLSNLHSMSRLSCAYFCETRPYNQGARLTSTELRYDGIPSTMVLDASVAALLGGAKSGQPGDGIKAIVVGADRVARNGDTANKIGTCQLAILARHFGVQFLVAAPWTTIDLDTPSGAEIKIEERPASEVRQVHGAVYENGSIKRTAEGIVQRGFVEVCGEDIDVWNPAFDVTPHALIAGIVTEKGVYVKDEQGNFNLPAEKEKLSSTLAETGDKLSTMTTSNEERQ